MSIEQTNKTKLLAQTQQFWKLSRQWNNVESAGISTQKALDMLSGIIATVGPKRRLSCSAGALIDDIIAPKHIRRRKQVVPINLLSRKRAVADIFNHQDVG